MNKVRPSIDLFFFTFHWFLLWLLTTGIIEIKIRVYDERQRCFWTVHYPSWLGGSDGR